MGRMRGQFFRPRHNGIHSLKRAKNMISALMVGAISAAGQLRELYCNFDDGQECRAKLTSIFFSGELRDSAKRGHWLAEKTG